MYKLGVLKRFKKTIITVGILGTVVLGVSACGSKDKNLGEVNIGYFNNVTHAQALLMKSEGSLEKSLQDDVKVNWTAFNAGPAEVEALFAGSIDIGYIGPVPAVTANVKSQGDVQIFIRKDSCNSPDWQHTAFEFVAFIIRK